MQPHQQLALIPAAPPFVAGVDPVEAHMHDSVKNAVPTIAVVMGIFSAAIRYGFFSLMAEYINNWQNICKQQHGAACDWPPASQNMDISVRAANAGAMGELENTIVLDGLKVVFAVTVAVAVEFFLHGLVQGVIYRKAAERRWYHPAEAMSDTQIQETMHNVAADRELAEDNHNSVEIIFSHFKSHVSVDDKNTWFYKICEGGLLAGSVNYWFGPKNHEILTLPLMTWAIFSNIDLLAAVAIVAYQKRDDYFDYNTAVKALLKCKTNKCDAEAALYSIGNFFTSIFYSYNNDTAKAALYWPEVIFGVLVGLAFLERAFAREHNNYTRQVSPVFAHVWSVIRPLLSMIVMVYGAAFLLLSIGMVKSIPWFLDMWQKIYDEYYNNGMGSVEPYTTRYTDKVMLGTFEDAAVRNSLTPMFWVTTIFMGVFGAQVGFNVLAQTVGSYLEWYRPDMPLSQQQMKDLMSRNAAGQELLNAHNPLAANPLNDLENGNANQPLLGNNNADVSFIFDRFLNLATPEQKQGWLYYVFVSMWEGASQKVQPLTMLATIWSVFSVMNLFLMIALMTDKQRKKYPDYFNDLSSPEKMNCDASSTPDVCKSNIALYSVGKLINDVIDAANHPGVKTATFAGQIAVAALLIAVLARLGYNKYHGLYQPAVNQPHDDHPDDDHPDDDHGGQPAGIIHGHVHVQLRQDDEFNIEQGGGAAPDPVVQPHDDHPDDDHGGQPAGIIHGHVHVQLQQEDEDENDIEQGGGAAPDPVVQPAAVPVNNANAAAQPQARNDAVGFNFAAEWTNVFAAINARGISAGYEPLVEPTHNQLMSASLVGKVSPPEGVPVHAEYNGDFSREYTIVNTTEDSAAQDSRSHKSRSHMDSVDDDGALEGSRSMLTLDDSANVNSRESVSGLGTPENQQERSLLINQGLYQPFSTSATSSQSASLCNG